MGCTFSQKIVNVDIWSSELNLPVLGGKTKKDRLRVNRKAFLMWVGDGVGGLLGGDKAYRKLTLKHHTDKVKRSMKVASWFPFPGEWHFHFLEALNVQPARSSFFFHEKCPLDVWKP